MYWLIWLFILFIYFAFFIGQNIIEENLLAIARICTKLLSTFICLLIVSPIISKLVSNNENPQSLCRKENKGPNFHNWILSLEPKPPVNHFFIIKNTKRSLASIQVFYNYRCNKLPTFFSRIASLFFA